MNETLTPPQSGFLLLDKPVGPTSFRMVQLVKRILRMKKVGHAGTLDPFASGLLILCVGREATRRISVLMGGEKEYDATLRLGVETDTQDVTGTVTACRPVGEMSDEEVARCLQSFVGEQLQTPPIFSALKHEGKPLYYYARKGMAVKKAPRLIQIHQIALLSRQREEVRIRVVCGKGTYIRSLAADIGAKLGCGAHLTELRRTRSGPFSVENALPGDCLRGDGEEALRVLIDSLRPVDEIVAGC